MAEFKVGDRVRTVETKGGYTFNKENVPGTVTSVPGGVLETYYLVDLDYVPGESDLLGTEGWAFRAEEIEHITNNTEEN